jgi:hypothetical protein
MKTAWLFCLLTTAAPAFAQVPIGEAPGIFPERPGYNGCYALSLWSGTGLAAWPSRLPYAYAPARILLIPDPASPNMETIRLIAKTAPGAVQPPLFYDAWVQRPARDSAVIEFLSGMHGISLRFRLGATTWRGVAVELSDIPPHPRPPFAQIVATKVDCTKWFREFRR